MAAERNWIDLEDDDSLSDALAAARLRGGAVFLRQGGHQVGMLSVVDARVSELADGATRVNRPDASDRPTPRRWDVVRDDDEEHAEILREVDRTGEPIQLFFDGHPGAILVPRHPTPPGPLPPGKTAEQLEAFRRAAGAWTDVDADAMVDEIYRLRIEGSRKIAES